MNTDYINPLVLTYTPTKVTLEINHELKQLIPLYSENNYYVRKQYTTNYSIGHKTSMINDDAILDTIVVHKDTTYITMQYENHIIKIPAKNGLVVIPFTVKYSDMYSIKDIKHEKGPGGSNFIVGYPKIEQKYKTPDKQIYVYENTATEIYKTKRVNYNDTCIGLRQVPNEFKCESCNVGLNKYITSFAGICDACGERLCDLSFL